MGARFYSLLAILAIAVIAPTYAEESKESAWNVQDLAGSRANIQLRSGKILRGVTIEEVKPGKAPQSVLMLRISNATNGAKSMLGASAIEQVITVDGECRLTFDPESKLLTPPDPEKPKVARKTAPPEKRTAATASDASLEKSSTGKSCPRTQKRSHAKNKQKQEEETPEAAENRRQAFFNQTGVWLWPELTDEQQKTEVAEQKKYLEKISRYFSGLNMQLQETRHFLFLSVFTPAQAAVYTPYLDSMHEELCKAYGIKNRDKVWKGKVPVIVFGRSDQFMEFEKVFFNNPAVPQQAQGLAHMDSTGKVSISCWCGTDPYYFGGVLVHETTHGFNHRYKSPQRLPSWLDEGVADWAAIAVVRGNRGARNRVRDALIQAKKQGNLGGDFFTAEQINGWQYGLAAGMTDFLLKTNSKAFRELLDGIKSGKKWEDALQESYGVTPAELTAQFGMSVGIPGLVP